MPPLPSRSWPRRPTELKTHSVGRIAIARCHEKMRSPSGPASVQGSPIDTGRWPGRPPTCALPGYGFVQFAGLVTKSYTTSFGYMNAVSELVVTMPNVVPFCAGMQSTLQIDRKVSRWLRGFLTSAVVRRGPGVPGGTAHIPRQHRDRRSHRPRSPDG